ncbi:hypothetical protein ACWEPL_21680 [Nonomuraea sp. NPDC004186]
MHAFHAVQERVGGRVDAAYRQGNRVTPAYDSLMAKLVVHAGTREDAIARAREALAAFTIAGPKQNLPFFTELLDEPEFADGSYSTALVARMRATPRKGS